MLLRLTSRAALLCSAALALPGTALAHDHRWGGHHRRADDGLPSRVVKPLARTQRALARAEERIDDGETARAVSTLTATRRNLAAAVRAAKRRLAGDAGSDVAVAVARVQHDVILEIGDLYDGQDGDVVDALTTTLTAALDGRDQIGGGVSALGEDELADFEDFLTRVDDDADEELGSLQEVRDDDEVSAAADAALAEALTRIAATQDAAQSRLETLSDQDDEDAGDDADLGDDEDGAELPAYGDFGDDADRDERRDWRPRWRS